MNRNLGEGSTMMASADTTSGATPSTWTNDSSPTADMTSTAVGGPYEPVAGAPTSKSDYTPCDGSESADDCIQLYERGVSGDGNQPHTSSFAFGPPLSQQHTEKTRAGTQGVTT